MTTLLSAAVIEPCRLVPRKAQDADREGRAEVFTADNHACRLAGHLGFTTAGTFWAHDARPEGAVAALSAFRP